MLACALLAAVAARAAPRGDAEPPEPPTPESREAARLQKVTDMHGWLPRLTGRFEIEGVVDFAPGAETPIQYSASGKADCIAIGEGAGVQCVIYMQWPEEWTSDGIPNGLLGESPFAPALLLYGLNPNAGLVRYNMLDTLGLVADGPAILKNDTLFWHKEGTTGVLEIWGRYRFRAPEGARYVQMTLYDGNDSPILNAHMFRRRADGQHEEASPASPEPPPIARREVH